MAITKNELIEALRAVASAEFEHIPKTDAEIDYHFSALFMKRMERLFRNQKKPYWKFINTVGKRVAVVAAAVLILFATACSIKPIREPMVRFFTEVCETFTAYFFESDTEEKAIEREYRLDPVPEGFTEVSRVVTKTITSIKYKNENGVTIKITQARADETTLHLDNEQNEATKEIVNGTEVILYCHQDKNQAMFLKDGYLFQIHCVGSSDLTLLYEIIENITNIS